MRKKPGVLAVCSLKGGVGKTMISLMLTRYLSKIGLNTFLVDADPQATASAHVFLARGGEEWMPENGFHKLVSLFIEKDGAPGCLSPDDIEANAMYVDEFGDEAFWILPNFIVSAYHESTLVAGGLHFAFLKEVISALEPLGPDVVIVDTPPYVNAYTTSAIAASDALIIPVELSVPSVESVSLTVRLVERLRGLGLLEDPRISIIASKVRRGVRSKRFLTERLVNQFGDMFFKEFFPLTEDIHKFYIGKYSIGALTGMKKTTSQQLRRVLDEILLKIVLYTLSEDAVSKLAKPVKVEVTHE